MTPLKQKLVIQQGKTFRFPVRWESEAFAYAAIAGISQGAPVTVTTADVHGIPDGWLVAVTSARGMTELNALSNPPEDSDYRTATLISPTEIAFNSLVSADFSAYTGGGFLQFRAPEDLAGYTARMLVKDRAGATLLTLTTENGGVLIDNTTKNVMLLISAAATAAITWRSGVYDLELISPTGVVTALLAGNVSVTPEVTT